MKKEQTVPAPFPIYNCGNGEDVFSVDLFTKSFEIDRSSELKCNVFSSVAYVIHKTAHQHSVQHIIIKNRKRCIALAFERKLISRKHFADVTFLSLFRQQIKLVIPEYALHPDMLGKDNSACNVILQRLIQQIQYGVGKAELVDISANKVRPAIAVNSV